MKDEKSKQLSDGNLDRTNMAPAAAAVPGREAYFSETNDLSSSIGEI